MKKALLISASDFEESAIFQEALNREYEKTAVVRLNYVVAMIDELEKPKTS